MKRIWLNRNDATLTFENKTVMLSHNEVLYRFFCLLCDEGGYCITNNSISRNIYNWTPDKSVQFTNRSTINSRTLVSRARLFLNKVWGGEWFHYDRKNHVYILSKDDIKLFDAEKFNVPQFQKNLNGNYPLTTSN